LRCYVAIEKEMKARNDVTIAKCVSLWSLISTFKHLEVGVLKELLWDLPRQLEEDLHGLNGMEAQFISQHSLCLFVSVCLSLTHNRGSLTLCEVPSILTVASPGALDCLHLSGPWPILPTGISDYTKGVCSHCGGFLTDAWTGKDSKEAVDSEDRLRNCSGSLREGW
jgi:hypothetical protein